MTATTDQPRCLWMPQLYGGHRVSASCHELFSCVQVTNPPSLSIFETKTSIMHTVLDNTLVVAYRANFFFFISLLLFGIHRHLRSAGAVFDRPPQRRPFSTAAALTTDLCISLSTSRVAPINSGLPVTRRPSQ